MTHPHPSSLSLSSLHSMRQPHWVALMQAADCLYGLVLVGEQVASLAQPRGATLHALDILALRMLLKGTPSLRAAQTFLPVCLPRFNPSAFLHAYVHYLHEVSAS